MGRSETGKEGSGPLAAAVEPLDDIEEANLDALLERIGEARVVLIGEASHGTSEFYRMRQRITKDLIQKKDFTIVSTEADWPDAERIDHYVRHRPGGPDKPWQAFSRFPTWMWRNHEVMSFISWLHTHNEGITNPDRRTGFYGLDLYSLYTSLHEVVEYLSRIDPALASVARQRYACLERFAPEPDRYGRSVAMKRYSDCEDQVVAMLEELLRKRLSYEGMAHEEHFDAVQNARVVAGAERYYRLAFQGSAESWNHRDQHMFETLQALLEHKGPSAKAVVWAHNSHIGDASATEASWRGQINIGELAREAHGDAAFLIGQGTHEGRVAAASDWDEDVEIMTVRPSLPGSIGRLCHETGIERFILPLRNTHRPEVQDTLGTSMLERFIGVIYRPQTERPSHYMEVVPASEYDAYIWFDRTDAVVPLMHEHVSGLPEGHPFVLID